MNVPMLVICAVQTETLLVEKSHLDMAFVTLNKVYGTFVLKNLQSPLHG